MDSNDLFKRLTTNLSFESTNPLKLKRKINNEESNGPNLKKIHLDPEAQIEQEITPQQTKKRSRKTKRKICFK